MTSSLTTALCLLVAGAALRGQSSPTPKFEVASIRPCKTPPTGQMHTLLGRLSMECSSVDGLIRDAYIQFAHGPAWRRVPGVALPIRTVSQGELSFPIKGSTGGFSPSVLRSTRKRYFRLPTT